MGIIASIIIGFIVGLLARFLMPGRDRAGCIVTTLLGMAGGFVGSFVGRSIGLYGEGDTAGLIMAVIGAILILIVVRIVFGKNREA